MAWTGGGGCVGAGAAASGEVGGVASLSVGAGEGMIGSAGGLGPGARGVGGKPAAAKGEAGQAETPWYKLGGGLPVAAVERNANLGNGVGPPATVEALRWDRVAAGATEGVEGTAVLTAAKTLTARSLARAPASSLPKLVTEAPSARAESGSAA